MKAPIYARFLKGELIEYARQRGIPQPELYQVAALQGALLASDLYALRGKRCDGKPVIVAAKAEEPK